MKKTVLHIDPSSGVSGDMLLGAFLDLGTPVEALFNAWNALRIDNYEVEIFETTKSGLRAVRCRIKTDEAKGPRNWRQYEKLLRSSRLKTILRDSALKLCKRLFEVESDFHQIPFAKLHLHEMGGTDLLLDVVGTLAAVDYIKPLYITAGAVNTGHGFIRFSHGHYPVPAPATAKLLEGVPIFQNEVSGELTTPTGALLITHLANSFGSMPAMLLEKTGVGAGERDTSPQPNVLRIFQGTVEESTAQYEDIYLVESNIDDSNPQVLGYFMERAFEQGALDVFFTSIFMKKNRPATRVSLLTPFSRLEDLIRLMFAETTAIGVRYWKVQRQKLERKWKLVKIWKNVVKIKESYLDGKLYNYQPEYEDCKALAQKLNKPLKEVLAAAVQAYKK
ncbi:MAG TPA: nickel pincer cofactor biosynthesis protein LarC [Acidobacteriota bacterium]|jgi:uncharacterized protein (TIGR00299 family) protein|nr:nickel pincer cofactor biosynthesis protein LarC [Acidobacteriota bacterium]